MASLTRTQRRIIILYAFPIVVLSALLAMYLNGGRYVSTENAYFRAGMVMVSANVSGEVDQVLVEENQIVRKGDLLFTLASAPFDFAVNEASAALIDARNNVLILRANLERQRREYAAAEEVVVYEAQELKRLQALIKTSAVSRSRLDAQTHALKVAKNRKASVQADIERVLAQLQHAPAQDVDWYPQVKRAIASLETAQLNRSYAQIRSKVNGVVARIDLHPGEYVRTGSAVFSLVESSNLWIEANLKETQLTNIEEGQHAKIRIDAFPGREFDAIITGVSPASGSEYAILPPQNATGNWVKVTRRIPVRLELIGEQDLPYIRAGMSAEVSIDTERQRSMRTLVAWEF